MVIEYFLLPDSQVNVCDISEKVGNQAWLVNCTIVFIKLQNCCLYCNYQNFAKEPMRIFKINLFILEYCDVNGRNSLPFCIYQAGKRQISIFSRWLNSNCNRI